MVTPAMLKDQLATKTTELKAAVAGVSEDKATQKPDGEQWCIKEVLAHLVGDEDALTMYQFKRFLDEENPDLSQNLTPGQVPSAKERASVSKLVADIESQYAQIGTFLSGLSDEQLSRKGRVPFLKETPLGENPTLGQWAGAIINFHLPDHIQQLRTLAQQ